MKSISAELKEHLGQEVTTLATCWKLTRRDATVLGFTDHDENIVYDSLTYEAATGMTPSAITSSASLNVDDVEVEGMLDSSTITETDLQAGLYDYAKLEIFILNYKDLSQGTLYLRRGYLGEVSISKERFFVEVRGLTQNLSQTFGELYSPSCRAELGDTRCKKNLSSFTVSGSITSLTSNAIFADSTRAETAGYFSQGSITFTSGANNGLSMEVKSFSQETITLVFPMPFEVQVGDTYTMVAGCNKTFQTCKAKFDNAVNFRGEPHVPGTDRMLETSSTRSS